MNFLRPCPVCGRLIAANCYQCTHCGVHLTKCSVCLTPSVVKDDGWCGKCETSSRQRTIQKDRKNRPHDITLGIQKGKERIRKASTVGFWKGLVTALVILFAILSVASFVSNSMITFAISLLAFIVFIFFRIAAESEFNWKDVKYLTVKICPHCEASLIRPEQQYCAICDQPVDYNNNCWTPMWVTRDFLIHSYGGIKFTNRFSYMIYDTKLKELVVTPFKYEPEDRFCPYS